MEIRVLGPVEVVVEYLRALETIGVVKAVR